MGKYTEIWETTLPAIKEAIKKGGDSIDMNESDFIVAGDRISAGYGFRLDIVNAVVPKKEGSAVARDLKNVLDADSEFRSLAKGKSFTIRMGKDFKLEIKS